MKKTNAKVAAMIGTCLEYYDMSLYGIMMPILITVFLPEMEKINALILTSLAIPLGLISRPLGAIFIGRIGDKYGRKTALIISIIGMAIVTGLTGLLPSFDSIGMAAPILFVIFRTLQGFFVAGEYNGAAIFVLEHSHKDEKGYISGLYCFFTVIGIAAAAIAASIVSYLPTEYWRAPYLFGACIGLFGIYLRQYVDETPEFIAAKKVHLISIKDTLKKYKLIIISIIIATFFSALYVLPTIFFNLFIPMVTDIETSTILTINSFSTIIYMLALPVMGKFADKVSLIRSMKLSALLVALLSFPLLHLISYNNLSYIIIMKVIFAFLTAWYVSPFHAWVQNIFETKERYTAISFSYSIGSQIGNLITPFGLWLWKTTESYLLLSLPIGILAILAFVTLEITKNKHE